MQEVCSLDGEKFESLFKILSIFEKSESIIINASNIKQQFNTATVSCDISELIGNNINLHILNPKKYIKLLKAFTKKSKKITISEDSERYVISNNEINIYCPKQIERMSFGSVTPTLDISGIGVDIKIDKDVRKTIKQLAADTDFVDMLVHHNQIKAISIPETAVYKFDNYVNEDIDESNCDFRLRVYTILEIDGENYNIAMGIDKSDNYWVRSVVDAGFVKICIDENAIRRDDLENMLI